MIFMARHFYIPEGRKDPIFITHNSYTKLEGEGKKYFAFRILAF